MAEENRGGGAPGGDSGDGAGEERVGNDASPAAAAAAEQPQQQPDGFACSNCGKVFTHVRERSNHLRSCLRKAKERKAKEALREAEKARKAANKELARLNAERLRANAKRRNVLQSEGDDSSDALRTLGDVDEESEVVAAAAAAEAEAEAAAAQQAGPAAEWACHGAATACGALIREAVPTMADCVVTDSADGAAHLVLYGGQVDAEQRVMCDEAVEMEGSGRFRAEHQLLSGEVYTCRLPGVGEGGAEDVTWVRRTPRQKRAMHAAVGIGGGKVVAMGGFEVESEVEDCESQLVFYSTDVLVFEPFGDEDACDVQAPVGYAPFPCTNPSLTYDAEKNSVYVMAGARCPTVYDPHRVRDVGNKARRAVYEHTWAWNMLYVYSVDAYTWRTIELLAKPEQPLRYFPIAHDGEGNVVGCEIGRLVPKEDMYPDRAGEKAIRYQPFYNLSAYASHSRVDESCLTPMSRMAMHRNCLRSVHDSLCLVHPGLYSYKVLDVAPAMPCRPLGIQKKLAYSNDTVLSYRGEHCLKYHKLDDATNKPGLDALGLRNLTPADLRAQHFRDGLDTGRVGRARNGMTPQEWRRFCKKEKAYFVPRLPLVTPGLREGGFVCSVEQLQRFRPAAKTASSFYRWRSAPLARLPDLPVRLFTDAGTLVRDVSEEIGGGGGGAAAPHRRGRTVYCLCVSDTCVRAKGPAAAARVDGHLRERFAADDARAGAPYTDTFLAQQHPYTVSGVRTNVRPCDTFARWRCRTTPLAGPDAADAAEGGDAPPLRVPYPHLHSYTLFDLEDAHAPRVRGRRQVEAEEEAAEMNRLDELLLQAMHEQKPRPGEDQWGRKRRRGSRGQFLRVDEMAAAHGGAMTDDDELLAQDLLAGLAGSDEGADGGVSRASSMGGRTSGAESGEDDGTDVSSEAP